MTSASAPDSMFLPWFSALASLKERLCPSQIDQINICSSLPATFYPLSSPSVSFLPQVFLIPTLSAFFCLFLFSSSHSFSITFFFYPPLPVYIVPVPLVLPDFSSNSLVSSPRALRFSVSLSCSGGDHTFYPLIAK